MNPNERIKWETRLLGAASVATVAVLIGAYAVQVRRAGKPGTEQDWRQAAQAWEDLQLLGR